eukprot:6617812-Alexandrium_andersonii.AAC.1
MPPRKPTEALAKINLLNKLTPMPSGLGQALDVALRQPFRRGAVEPQARDGPALHHPSEAAWNGQLSKAEGAKPGPANAEPLRDRAAQAA